MATPKVFAEVTPAWTNVIGAAAGVPGVTWQNEGANNVQIAFTAAAPADRPTDAFHTLQPLAAFYDESGSAACWVRSMGPGGVICGTAA